MILYIVRKKDRSFFFMGLEILECFFRQIGRYGGHKSVFKRGEKLYFMLVLRR